MRNAEDINFGVEIEAHIVDHKGVPIAPGTAFLNKPLLSTHTEALLSDFEVRNSNPTRSVQHAIKEVSLLIEQAKQEAEETGFNLLFDSRVNEEAARYTIGIHVHLDLTPYQELISKDPNFVTLVSGYLMQNRFLEIIKNFCYSKRISSRVKQVLRQLDFNCSNFDNRVFRSQFIYFSVRSGRDVKIIKHRPDKKSLEICIPDSFDVTADPTRLESLIELLRKSLHEAVVAYQNGEIEFFTDEECGRLLSRVV